MKKTKLELKVAEAFRCVMTIISPSLNIVVCYRFKIGKWPNIKNPQTFKEKLLKLRINDYSSNLLVKKCADKYKVRDYVVEKLGNDKILNRLIAVYDTPDEIDWDKLPSQFAIKWNFGCGYNIIVPDKNVLDRELASQQLKKWGKRKYWLGYAEMQYKDVQKKILIEEFLLGKNGGYPEDYKLYCFNGVCRAILYISDRETHNKHAGFFDSNWNYLGRTGKDSYSDFEVMPQKPSSLQTMILSAEKLSKPFPFVRVDFYDVEGRAVFGEMTFTPAGASDVSEIDINGQSMGELLQI